MIQTIKYINHKSSVIINVDESSKLVSYIYVDAYENKNNRLSPKADDHSFKFDREDLFPIQTGWFTDFKITADMMDLPNNRIVNLYTITVVYEDNSVESSIMYDLNELYCLRMKYLKEDPQCRPHNMQQLTVLMFRETIFRNAVAFGDIDTALEIYADMFRNIKSESSNINSVYNYFDYDKQYR